MRAACPPGEVGKEIAEHRRHDQAISRCEGEATGRDRTITIIEAVLLAAVAVLGRVVGVCLVEVEHRVVARTGPSLGGAQRRTRRSRPRPAQLRRGHLQHLVHRLHRRNQAAEQVAPPLRPTSRWPTTRSHPEHQPQGTAWPHVHEGVRAARSRAGGALDAKATELYAEGAHDGCHRRRLRAHHRLPGHRAVPGGGISGHFTRCAGPRHVLVGVAAPSLGWRWSC